MAGPPAEEKYAVIDAIIIVIQIDCAQADGNAASLNWTEMAVGFGLLKKAVTISLLHRFHD